jgi:hypothetical protein
LNFGFVDLKISFAAFFFVSQKTGRLEDAQMATDCGPGVVKTFCNLTRCHHDTSKPNCEKNLASRWVLVKPDQSMLYMRGGAVLAQKEKLGDQFFVQLDEIFKKGPEPLAADEI